MSFNKKFVILASIFILLIIFLISFAVISSSKRQEAFGCPDCNIVFVSFDDLRADRIGVNGNRRQLTPNIDQIAKKGVNFANTISASSWTLPSSMSWFTGVYPLKHKVVNKVTILNGKEEETSLKKFAPQLTTLAAEFLGNGYRTAAFTGDAGLGAEFGFSEGFEVYLDDVNFGGFEHTAPAAISWIKEHKGEKFFVFLHGYDIHGQYQGKEPDLRFVDFDYKGKLSGSVAEQKELREQALAQNKLFLTSEDVRFLSAVYDEKVQDADSRFGEFVKEYRDLGLFDKTIFILTSDHGEELYEHGRIDHGHSLYDELIHVPLIIGLPFGESWKIEQQVRSIDIAPTILELAGVGAGDLFKRQLDGVSLVPAIQGQKLSLDAFAETDYRYATSQRAVRTADGWKLIANLETGSMELYNLNNDPREQKNMISSNKSEANKLQEILGSQFGLILK